MERDRLVQFLAKLILHRKNVSEILEWTGIRLVYKLFSFLLIYSTFMLVYLKTNIVVIYQFIYFLFCVNFLYFIDNYKCLSIKINISVCFSSLERYKT